jgi:hypothetical protein
MQGQRYPVAKADYRIGCKADNDYVPDYHASLRYEQGSLYLFDRGGACNGTFPNSQPVMDIPFIARRGDEIRVGASVRRDSNSPGPYGYSSGNGRDKK